MRLKCRMADITRAEVTSALAYTKAYVPALGVARDVVVTEGVRYRMHEASRDFGQDFGELVSVRRLPHPCIIRFIDMRVEEKVMAMRELLEHHADAIREGALIVVTRGRVRIRFAARESGGSGGH